MDEEGDLAGLMGDCGGFRVVGDSDLEGFSRGIFGFADCVVMM